MNKTLTKIRCRKIIPLFLKMIQNLKQSPFKSLVALGKTLDSWKEEIACMWRFSKSNGITEGFHRKMKLIQRRAYGFRNFENYRLRVRVLWALPQQRGHFNLLFDREIKRLVYTNLIKVPPLLG